MNNCTLRDISLADSVASKVVVEATTAKVHLKDWQETKHLITFHGVLSVEELGLIGEDLSHMTVSRSDVVLTALCKRAEETPTDFKSFSIFGVWSDEPLIRVVAANFSYM